MALEPGQLVISTAGRDQGKAFIVIGIEQLLHGTYAYIADGGQRKVHQPKRKSIKHLKASQLKAPEINAKLIQGAIVSNAELRKTVAALVAIYEGNPET